MITETDGGAEAHVDDAYDADAHFEQLANPALSGEPEPASEPVKEPAPEPVAAPVASDPVKEPPAETHRVPLSEHLAEREKRQEWERKAREYERLLQQTQQAKEPPKAPEFWEQPETSVDYRVQQAVAPLQQALQQQAEMFSRVRAEDKYGAEVVEAAYKDLAERVQSGDPSARFDYQRIMAGQHPYGALVELHRQRETLREIGSDPAAYKEKLAGDLLNDPAFLAKALEAAKAKAAQNPSVVTFTPSGKPKSAAIPSVSTMGSAASATGGIADDASDDDLFDRFASMKR